MRNRPAGHGSCPNGRDRCGIVVRAEDRRAGDDDVGAGLDRLPGVVAILPAIDLYIGSEATRFAEFAQAADLGQHLGQERLAGEAGLTVMIMMTSQR